MYPCVHVSMYPCIHVSVCPCIHVSMCPCIHVSMYPCIRVSVYPCIHVFMYPCILGTMYACCNTFMAAIDHSNPTAAHPQCMQYMRCDAPSHHVPCSSANWKQSVKDFYNGLEGGVWISFRSMPKVKRRRVATDRDEGSLSETPSARSIGRCPQIDTGPRCSPSACLEMSVKKKRSALGQDLPWRACATVVAAVSAPAACRAGRGRTRASVDWALQTKICLGWFVFWTGGCLCESKGFANYPIKGKDRCKI